MIQTPQRAGRAQGLDPLQCVGVRQRAHLWRYPDGLQRSRRQNRQEQGSATLEVVVLAPALLLLLSVLIAGARIRMAETSVDQAAGVAARAASLARSAGRADDDALDAARTVLKREGLRCSSTSIDVETGGFSEPVGSPAQVVVRVSCTVPLSDLAVPGLPGSRTLSASATSVLDTYRDRS
jgi:Flp pilus assembly protein TadG